MANQALEMALGRGGDQAVVKLPNNEYKFYGGVAGAIEKHNKVRARIIANSLKGLIASSSNVVLMGHRFSDLDALGSCIALASAAKAPANTKIQIIYIMRELADPFENCSMRSSSDAPRVMATAYTDATMNAVVMGIL
jgi:c-di-AMP phosphodiesterase-like protein